MHRRDDLWKSIRYSYLGCARHHIWVVLSLLPVIMTHLIKQKLPKPSAFLVQGVSESSFGSLMTHERLRIECPRRICGLIFWPLAIKKCVHRWRWWRGFYENIWITGPTECPPADFMIEYCIDSLGRCRSP